MREVRVKSSSEIQLGRRGENLATRVIFHVGDWLSEPSGSIQLIHQRPGDDHPYPCAITADGDTVIWDILSADVGSPGRGRAELQYLRGDVCIKSSIFITNTADALDKAGEIPPDPHKSWLQQVLQAAEGIESGIEKAEEAAQTALGYANAAGEAAEKAVLKGLAYAKESGEFDGPAGPAGSDASVTAANIKIALGYTPADAKVVSQLSEEISRLPSFEFEKWAFTLADGTVVEKEVALL